jgi:hypothetical protein
MLYSAQSKFTILGCVEYNKDVAGFGSATVSGLGHGRARNFVQSRVNQ